MDSNWMLKFRIVLANEYEDENGNNISVDGFAVSFVQSMS